MSVLLASTSDLVSDSRLRTTVSSGRTHHIRYTSSPDPRRRRTRTEETWKRLRQLGNGTFGRVWLEDCESGPKSGQLRAVKEISKDKTLGSSIDCNRELEAMAKFSHDRYAHCFVRFFGWYESRDAVFIAMEYFEHGDLQKYLVDSFPESDVKRIVSQLAEGLSFMHNNRFAHRDLKPANVLVVSPQPDWWVKISDFGISKRAEAGSALRTAVGTQGYIAPELIGIFPISESRSSNNHSQPSYTATVDIWALGEMAVRMLTQRSAFRDPRELFDYVVHENPFPCQLLEGLDVGDECYRFLERAMAPSPSRRLSAREAIDHPWLQASRPSSRASSLESNTYVETSSFAQSISVTEEAHMLNTDMLGSAVWSTLDCLDELPRPNISNSPQPPTHDNQTTNRSASSLSPVINDNPVDKTTVESETVVWSPIEAETTMNLREPFTEQFYDDFKSFTYTKTAEIVPTNDLTQVPTPIHDSTLEFRNESDEIPAWDVSETTLHARSHGGEDIPGIDKQLSILSLEPKTDPPKEDIIAVGLLRHSSTRKHEELSDDSVCQIESDDCLAEFQNLRNDITQANIKSYINSIPASSTQELRGLDSLPIVVSPRPENPSQNCCTRITSISISEDSDISLGHSIRRPGNPGPICNWHATSTYLSKKDPYDVYQVHPEEVQTLINQCTIDLKKRSLEYWFFSLPLETNPIPIKSTVRRIVRLYFSRPSYFCTSPGRDRLTEELRMAEPTVVAAILKWCWARLPGGVVGWDRYERFKIVELESNMASDAFYTFLESEVHKQIILDFFDLLFAAADHEGEIGLNGLMLPRKASWWAFELENTDTSFDAGYTAWLAAADATSDLFFALLRAHSGEVPLSFWHSFKFHSPPNPKSLFHGHTPKIIASVSRTAASPFGVLHRSSSLPFYVKKDFQEFFSHSGTGWALTWECFQAFKAISAHRKMSSLPGPIPSEEGSNDDLFAKFFSEAGEDLSDNSSIDNIEPQNARIDRFDLDESFWWVWMQSFAPEETPQRARIFSHTVVVNTVLPGSPWLVFEDTLQVEDTLPVSETTKPRERKSILGWMRDRTNSKNRK